MGRMKDLAIMLMEQRESDHVQQQADEYAASLEYQAACEEAEQWEKTKLTEGNETFGQHYNNGEQS